MTLCVRCGDPIPEGQDHACWLLQKLLEQETLPDPDRTDEPAWRYWDP